MPSGSSFDQGRYVNTRWGNEIISLDSALLSPTLPMLVVEKIPEAQFVAWALVTK